MTKTKSVWSFGCVAVALVILSNPVPLLIDLLPDAVGYLLLIIGLYKLSNMLPDFEELKNQGCKLLLISTLKIPAFFLMASIYGSSTNQRVIVPTFTLAFAAIELVFVIPFIRQFFLSFERLGEHYQSSIALKGKQFSPDSLEKMMITFFIIKEVCSTLPEFCLVPYYSGSIEVVGFKWNNLYPIAAIIAFIVVIVFQIRFLKRFLPFLSGISKESETNELLYSSFLLVDIEKRKRFSYIKVACGAYLIGVFCTFDFYFSNINYLPDYLAAICFIICVLCLCYSTTTKPYVFLVFPIAYLAFSIVHYTIHKEFFQTHTFYDIEYSIKGAEEYKSVLLFSFIQELLGIGVAITLAILLFKMIKQHVGKISNNPSHMLLEKQTKKEVQVKVIVLSVLLSLSFVASFVYELTLSKITLENTQVNGNLSTFAIPELSWFPVIVWTFNICTILYSVFAWLRFTSETALNLKYDD